MATAVRISIEEYLGQQYEPDVEYIDGELKERPVVFSVHGYLQVLIGAWFMEHEDEWGVRAGVEIRTRVSSTRVRLPDVVVNRARRTPATLVDPPLIVIEILSPRDTYTNTERLAQDYLKMGIRNIWLIDPDTRTGRSCQENAWIETNRFTVADSPIYLDLTELFARLNRYDEA